MTLHATTALVADSLAADPKFREAVLAGLARNEKTIEPRWFYDRRGSELFEQITALPEYYLTRAEREILVAEAAEIAALVGPHRTVVEYGSGSSSKTPLVLSAMNAIAYVPIDISGEFLGESAEALKDRFCNLLIYPIEADFSESVTLPPMTRPPYLGFFPGSTIGNLQVAEAVGVLHLMAKTLGPGAMLLIGMDRVKDESILVPAYNDAQGVTARFNLNLLERINRELGGTIPVDAFRHVAKWNAEFSRIEMRLEAIRSLRFRVDGQAFHMQAGETIHTENSHKYDHRSASLLLRAGNWEPIREWSDRFELFSVILARATDDR